MKTITRTKAGSPPLLFLPLFFAALGVLVLALSVPSLVARLTLLPGDDVREAVLAGGDITEDDLKLWDQSRTRALLWRTMAVALEDLSLNALTWAQRLPDGGEEGKAAWREALRWQQRALSRAPADTFGWARLAYATTRVEGLTEGAAAALTRSLETGPHEPSLLLFRLVMAVSLQDKLDEDVRASLPAMIRAAWEKDPARLAQAAHDNHFISLVESALAEQPEHVEAFRGRLPKAPGPEDAAPSKE